MMDVEQALSIIDQSLKPKGLTDIQELIFRQCWQGKSYYDIAQEFEYEVGYLRIAGSQLWQQLSKALGEKVTKANLQSVLRRRMNAIAPSFILNPSPTKPEYPDSLGLIKLKENKATPSCELYRQYFGAGRGFS
ncbi:hypothetical protein [Coleofasciculus sp. E1-EBD-02]|uniref:hypothetical protein n=1 Tax=Coleofasciculus sp. E1-EBD-02 TaxID=3068481 RepID=UPI0032F7FBBD